MISFLFGLLFGYIIGMIVGDYISRIDKDIKNGRR